MLFAFLVFATLFLYFYNLGFNQVWQPNEAFYAEAAKNMLRSGDFLTPVFNGEIRLNKPPMTYWLTALSFYIFGVNEFALRFFQVIAGLGTGILTFLIACKFTERETALLAFVLLTLSFQFIANARYTSPEVLLTFFITLSLYLWYISYEKNSKLLLFLSFTASALAVLTKGPVGFLLPALIIFMFLLFTNPKEILRKEYYIGSMYVFLISGWWFVYQFIKNQEIFSEVFIKENIKRIYSLQQDPFYFYLLDIPVSFLPYSFVFFIAFFWILKNKLRNLLFPVVWFTIVFLVFSFVKMKLPVYIMPAFPAMAVLTAEFVKTVEPMRILKGLYVFLGILLLLATLTSAVLFKFNFPVLLLSGVVFFLPVILKNYRLIPAFGAVSLFLYLSAVILPHVEKYRPYKSIGDKIKQIDPSAKLKFYEVGAFHYNLPFYTDRIVLRKSSVEEIKGKALILVKENIYKCNPVAEWNLYLGSESRFFKFLIHIKENRNFGKFKLCIFNREI